MTLRFEDKKPRFAPMVTCPMCGLDAVALQRDDVQLTWCCGGHIAYSEIQLLKDISIDPQLD